MTEKRSRLLFMIVVIILILPFIGNIWYSLPSADDFSMLYDYDHSISIFVNAISKANTMWITWSGEWSYSFIQILINPLLFSGCNSRLLGIELIIFFIIFIAAIVVCIRELICEIFQCKSVKYVYFAIALILIMVMNSGLYPEIYTWFIGSIYMIELTFTLFCIYLIFRYYNNSEMKTAVVLSIFGFFTCMGIMVVSIVCLVYLFLFFPAYIKKKKKMRNFIPFLFCVSGGIVSVAAPGNYARHDTVETGGLHFFKAVKNTLYIECMYSGAIIRDVLIGMCLIIIAVIFYYYARKHKINNEYIHPLWAIVFYVLSNFLVIFPFALGYSSADVPNRIQYVINTFIILGLGFCAIDFGIWLGSKEKEPVDKKSVRIIAFVLLLAVYLGPLNKEYFRNTPYAQQIIGYNDTVACYDDWQNIFSEIEDSTDDVVIRSDGIHASPNIKSPMIMSDTSHWINISVARYFNKKTVKMITVEND